MRVITTALFAAMLMLCACQPSIESQLKEGVIEHEKTADEAENLEVKILSYDLMPASYYYMERYNLYNSSAILAMTPPPGTDTAQLAKLKADAALQQQLATFTETLRKTDTSKFYLVKYHASFTSPKQKYEGNREIWISPATMRRVNINIDSLYKASH